MGGVIWGFRGDLERAGQNLGGHCGVWGGLGRSLRGCRGDPRGGWGPRGDFGGPSQGFLRVPKGVTGGILGSPSSIFEVPNGVLGRFWGSQGYFGVPRGILGSLTARTPGTPSGTRCAPVTRRCLGGHGGVSRGPPAFGGPGVVPIIWGAWEGFGVSALSYLGRSALCTPSPAGSY